MNTAKLKRKLTTEWRVWIKENIRNGTPFQSIVAFLIQNQFDPVYAMTAVQILYDEVKSEYIYDTPRIMHNDGYVQTSDRRIPVRTLMEKPCIAVLDDVLTAEECDRLISVAHGRLERSKIDEGIIDPIRTSFGTSFKRGENEFISSLERRFSEIMNLPPGHGEELQILNYQPGAEYKPHFDYFPPTQKGKKLVQRISTLVVYLNDVEEGGTTSFPLIGLTVYPMKGSALYFEYLNSHGQVDALTLHSGGPVKKGEKWVLTQWMRERSITVGKSYDGKTDPH